MKRILIPVLCLITAVLASAFQTISETRTLDAFKRIRIEGPLHVKVVSGKAYSIVIETEDEPTSRIRTSVDRDKLSVQLQHGRFQGRAKVLITCPDLSGLELSGTATVSFPEERVGRYLEVKATGAASADLRLRMEEVRVAAETSSDIRIEGTVGSLIADCATASGLDAFSLQADRVDVRVRTASQARVSVKSELKAEASTAGVVKYRGDPVRSNTQSTTAGVIRRID